MNKLNIGRERYDPKFVSLKNMASEKGLILNRNCVCMGFKLKFPDGHCLNFKSFLSLTNFIMNYEV